MKSDEARPGSTGILIGAVIAILALVRGPWQTWLLVGVFAIWGLRLLKAYMLPITHRTNRRRKRRHRRKRLPADDGPDISAWVQEPDSASAENLLLRHADITLDQQANIACSMLRIVPLADTGNDTPPEGQAPSGRQPIDPQVWYEIQGRAVLEALVTDLDSRGYSCLTLHENGDACVEEGQQEVPKERLPGFPERVYWNRLVEVLESNGLTAEATPGGIRVCW